MIIRWQDIISAALSATRIMRLFRNAGAVPGYADGYTYKQEDRDKLRGRYVGGIVGYGEQSVHV